MKRNIDLNEITDGRFYLLDDMVRADCRDCVGCSKCCHEMVDTILLDPLDCFRLSMALSCSFDDLITGEKIELELIDGIILPHLKFQQNTGCCPFLNHLGRCDIHAFRPGFCRMFPLGRYYFLLYSSNQRMSKTTYKDESQQVDRYCTAAAKSKIYQ